MPDTAAPARRPPRPHVAVGSLGGTIAMTPDAHGRVSPTLAAPDLVAAVPGLGDVADVAVTTLASVPSASLSFEQVLDALAWARAAVAGGADGVVLVQGTDTLEETAYLLDLHWELSHPLVLTGAMRPPQQPGADGPANLLAAVTVAGAGGSRDLGVLVVLHDEVHAAARVRKVHATSVTAFASPGTGPLGRVVEGRVALTSRPVRHASLPDPHGTRLPRVALLESTLDDRGALVDAAVAAGLDGVVLAAFGAGHVSGVGAEAVSRALSTVPVVVATRTGAGSTLTATYGYPGSETDLQRRGAVLAGSLDPRKARLLLCALIAGGADRDAIGREFTVRGSDRDGR